MIERARDLRAEGTMVEQRLWQILRNRKMGAKFRRQHPIDKFVLDFACEELRLGIELDGSQHNEARGLAYDARRSEMLAASGWKILRFWNNEVIENLEGVYQVIAEAVKDR